MGVCVPSLSVHQKCLFVTDAAHRGTIRSIGHLYTLVTANMDTLAKIMVATNLLWAIAATCRYLQAMSRINSVKTSMNISDRMDMGTDMDEERLRKLRKYISDGKFISFWKPVPTTAWQECSQDR